MLTKKRIFNEHAWYAMVKFWVKISLFKLNLQNIIQKVKDDKRVVVLRV